LQALDFQCAFAVELVVQQIHNQSTQVEFGYVYTLAARRIFLIAQARELSTNIRREI